MKNNRSYLVKNLIKIVKEENNFKHANIDMYQTLVYVNTVNCKLTFKKKRILLVPKER